MTKTQRARDEDFLRDIPDGPPRHSVDRRDVPQYMPDNARMLAFTAIAALLDSGLALSEAVGMLTDEYEAKGSARAADMLRQFFGAVVAVMNGNNEIDLKTEAGKAFGNNFVSLEESLVLSTLPRSTRKAETLRAAAGLVSFKGSRPVPQIPHKDRR